MAEQQITAHVEETGESKFAVNINVSGHMIKGDEPLDANGGNLGPAPFDLLTAALGECTAMTIRWYAARENWPLDKVEVNLTHHKEATPGSRIKADIFTKDITLYGDKLTAEQRTKLIEIAAKCPVQRTLENTPVIKTTGR
ncbi:MAG TPA: OsmC family protein [Rickettsiales bacterium]|nr:OsmC family protein [Rickettsiales bacterium]